jgi:site-specific recombinase XerC
MLRQDNEYIKTWLLCKNLIYFILKPFFMGKCGKKLENYNIHQEIMQWFSQNEAISMVYFL